MKPLLLAILGSALVLTACSDKPEPTTDNQPISTKQPIQKQQPQPQPQVAQEQTTKNNSETTKTENVAKTTAKQAKENAPAKTASVSNIDTNKLVADANLKDELLLFTQSLDMISQELRGQHEIIYKKEKQAKSRQDDDEIAKLTIKVLSQQKDLLLAIPLTNSQLLAIRDKYAQSAELAIEAHKEMISIRQPTAEDEKKLVAKFTQGKKLADEAKKDLQGLIQQVNKK